MISKVIFILLVGATFAFAQVEVVNSHLNCFRGFLDEAFQFKALVNLKANEQQIDYSLEGCRVKSKKIDLCVPSTKKIIQTSAEYPSIIYDVKPQQLKNDFICYRLKCNRELNPQLPVEQPAADQFGIKYFEFGDMNVKNYFRLCVPAWKIGTDGRPIILN